MLCSSNNKLQKQIKDGSLSRQDAIARSYELREKPNKPEEITIENIDSSLDFLNNESYFEDLHREKEKKEFILKQTLKENEDLQNEIERRNEIERKKILDSKNEQTEIDKQNFINEKWKQFKNQQFKNLFYFLLVLFLTILPIFIGFMLKGNKALSDWMESLGNRQYWIWSILTIIFLAELFGRSYILNKEQVKNGWLWLNSVLSGRKYQEIKDTKIIDWQSDFEKQSDD